MKTTLLAIMFMFCSCGNYVSESDIANSPDDMNRLIDLSHMNYDYAYVDYSHHYNSVDLPAINVPPPNNYPPCGKLGILIDCLNDNGQQMIKDDFNCMRCIGYTELCVGVLADVPMMCVPNCYLCH